MSFPEHNLDHLWDDGSSGVFSWLQLVHKNSDIIIVAIFLDNIGNLKPVFIKQS